MKHVYYPSDSTCVWEEHTFTPQPNTPINPIYTNTAQLRHADDTEQLPSFPKENWNPFHHSPTTHCSAPTYTQHTPREQSMAPDPTQCLGLGLPTLKPHWSNTCHAKAVYNLHGFAVATTHHFNIYKHRIEVAPDASLPYQKLRPTSRYTKKIIPKQSRKRFAPNRLAPSSKLFPEATEQLSHNFV